QLFVSDEGVGVGSRSGLMIGRRRRDLSRRGWQKCGLVMQEFVRPGDKVFPVGAVGVTAVVLAPRQLAIEQAHSYRRHFCSVVIFGNAQSFCAEKLEYGAGRYGSHETALRVEPFRVTSLWHAVADERQTRRAKGDKFVRVDGKIAGVLAAKYRFRGAVLQEIACHPVIFARARKVFDGFTKIAAIA